MILAPHTGDSPGYTPKEIEDGFLRMLAPMQVDDRIQLPVMMSYGGQLHPGRDPERAPTNFPAVYVEFVGNMKVVDKGARKIDLAQVNVYYAVKNMRSEEEARNGSLDTVGVQELLRAGQNILWGSGLNMAIEILQKTRDYKWYGMDSGVLVWVQEWTLGNFHIYQPKDTNVL